MGNTSNPKNIKRELRLAANSLLRLNAQREGRSINMDENVIKDGDFEQEEVPWGNHRGLIVEVPEIDMVNHPPHYEGPEIELGQCDTYGTMKNWAIATYQLGGKRWWKISCITIMRHIKDPRLATAFKYIWRASFKGKNIDNGGRKEDVKNAIWYLNDYVVNDI